MGNAVFFLPIVFFSVILHEISHGLAALKLGDPTARDAGRLTLNPIKHVDVFGTILVPLMLILSGSGMLFGWAKPVPVNPGYFRNPKRDFAVSSLAGPATNLLLAVAAGALFRLLSAFSVSGFLLTAAAYAVYLNFVLCIFNLLPIPPLDGSRLVYYLLPSRWAQGYISLERYGLLIVIGALVASQYIRFPIFAILVGYPAGFLSALVAGRPVLSVLASAL